MLPEDEYLQEKIALRMLKLLQEHGWDFTYGRDPLLILIEYEEIQLNGDNEDHEQST